MMIFLSFIRSITIYFFLLQESQTKALIPRLKKALILKQQSNFYAVELPRFNEPLYNKVLGIMNDIFKPSNRVMYGREPWYNEPSM